MARRADARRRAVPRSVQLLGDREPRRRAHVRGLRGHVEQRHDDRDAGLARAPRRAVLAARRRVGRRQARLPRRAPPARGRGDHADAGAPEPRHNSRRRSVALLAAQRRRGDRRVPDRAKRGMAGVGGLDEDHGRLQRRGLRPASVGGMARRLHARGGVGHRESATRGNLHPIEDVDRLVARWDLLGTSRTPAVPPAMRYVYRGVSALDDGRSRPDGSRRAARAAAPTAQRSESRARGARRGVLGRAPRAPRTAGPRSWPRSAAEARAVLDDDRRARPRLGRATRHAAPRRPRSAATRAGRGRAAASRRLRALRRYPGSSSRTRPRRTTSLRASRRWSAPAPPARLDVVVLDARGRLAATLDSVRTQCLRPHRGRSSRRTTARCDDSDAVARLSRARQTASTPRSRRRRASSSSCSRGRPARAALRARPRRRRPGRRKTPPTATRTARRAGRRVAWHLKPRPLRSRDALLLRRGRRAAARAPLAVLRARWAHAVGGPGSRARLRAAPRRAHRARRPRRRGAGVARRGAPDLADATAATIPRGRRQRCSAAARTGTVAPARCCRACGSPSPRRPRARRRDRDPDARPTRPAHGVRRVGRAR